MEPNPSHSVIETVMPLSGRDEQTRRLVETLRRQLGPVGCAAMVAPGVTDLILNPDGTLWADRAGEGMVQIGAMSVGAAAGFIGTVASILRTTVTRDAPIVECELPVDPPFYGARFAGSVPPIGTGPEFAIRIPNIKQLSLEDYVRHGVMTQAQRQVIEDVIRNRENLLIIGGTGSGKTTLLNACLTFLSEIAPHDRIGILEDGRELRPTSRNVFAFRTSPTVSMRALLKTTLRRRPDRILIGETRGGEALDMLKAWNTGHDGGMSTAHANDARAGLVRIEDMVAEVSVNPMQRLIAEAVDVIVSIKRDRSGTRHVREVVRVDGYANGAYQFTNLAE